MACKIKWKHMSIKLCKNKKMKQENDKQVKLKNSHGRMNSCYRGYEDEKITIPQEIHNLVDIIR